MRRWELLAFAMAAGAGCCYRIMAESAPYIMPVETVPYEVETLLSKTEPLGHENDTLQAKMITENEKMITENEEPLTEVAPEQLYDIPLSAELQQDIRELAERYEVSYELVLAVIMTESSGNPDYEGNEYIERVYEWLDYFQGEAG